MAQACINQAVPGTGMQSMAQACINQAVPGTDQSNTVLTDMAKVSESSLSPGQMIFVNNDLDMEDVKAIGFDMDYTLAQYISPHFETLGFDLAKKQMVFRGYPKHFETFEYDPTFAQRGLWFDQHFGNLLKVDKFGIILAAFHGFRVLSEHEIVTSYPQKLQKLDTARIFVMHTHFNLPETCLLACIIHFYDNSAEEFQENGWTIDGKVLTFRKMFQDIRACIDDIHVGSMSLKTTAIANLPHYLTKDAQLPALLQKLRASGKIVFLLTNSGWWYTNSIMKFLLEDDQHCGSWISYFDYTFLDAGKPSFYTSGSPLQQVEPSSGSHFPLGHRKCGANVYSGGSEAEISRLLGAGATECGGNVYSGGSEAEISRLMGAGATEILYVGDHLHADVVMARQLSSWSTLMIVPELLEEFEVMEKTGKKSFHLDELKDPLQNGEYEDNERKKFEQKEAVKILNKCYRTSGSIFKEGKRLTMFGSSMMYWADIYTADALNLLHCQEDHRFVANVSHLPHNIF